MNKDHALMRDVITKHHPEFTKNKTMSKYALKNPEIFNIELLMDQCLSTVGGYNYVDEWGRDFDDADNSDGKTATVRSSDRKLLVRSVECKIGSLRVTAWNEILDKTVFFYIPKADVTHLKSSQGVGNKLWIRTTWTQGWMKDSDGHYNMLNKFRVADFQKLATSTDQTFKYWQV